MHFGNFIPHRVCYSCMEKTFEKSELTEFIRKRRKSVGLTQEQMAKKAGVGLRFVRELEQGKRSLKMDKVDQVLWLFGMEAGAVPMDRSKI